ncbi:MAG: DUF45 domain-containing protein [Candidatus Peribacteria bacterium]|nr:MAG: DUF45 domain-containing protein [Candidatus Peribacteria bacterium]
MPHIVLQEQQIPYTLKISPRARHLRMVFVPGKDLEVSIPRGMSSQQISKFLHEKQQWILKHYLRSQAETNPDLAADSREHFLQHKDAALAWCTARVERWNQLCQFEYQHIRVKDMKSKWGSCSSK